MALIFKPDARKLRWIRIEGPDARDFLHRLTTAQVRNLATGDGALTCFLSPQGKIRAAFQLWRTGPEAFAMETELPEETLAVIDQFTFGEKMSVAPSPWTARWILPDAGERLSIFEDERDRLRCQQDAGIQYCFQGSAAFGRPWITAWGPDSDVDQNVSALWPRSKVTTHEELERYRILAIWPRVGHEISSDVNPLEIGLRRAVADNKGCYPGQEVLEKIIAIGAPARRLTLLEINGEATVPASLPLPLMDESGHECGKLTSLAPPDRALALLRKTHLTPGTSLHTASGLHGRVLKTASDTLYE